MNVVYVFIDASNIWEAQKSRGRFFDYEKLKNFLKKEFNARAIEVFYYSAYPGEGTRDYNLDGRHAFFTFLQKGLKFTVRKKKLKQIGITTSEGYSIKEKGNMDVEMTIDALHHIKKYNIAVLFTGDSDFLALVTYLRTKGKRVFIFSSKNNVSEELRTGSDGYYDILKDIKNNIWRSDLRHRAELEKESK